MVSMPSRLQISHLHKCLDKLPEGPYTSIEEEHSSRLVSLPPRHGGSGVRDPQPGEFLAASRLRVELGEVFNEGDVLVQKEDDLECGDRIERSVWWWESTVVPECLKGEPEMQKKTL